MSSSRSLAILSASSLLLSSSSSVQRSLINFCSSASFMPSLGMNLCSCHVLKDLASGAPLRLSGVYEFRCLDVMHCGIDHFGSSLHSVLNV